MACLNVIFKKRKHTVVALDDHLLFQSVSAGLDPGGGAPSIPEAPIVVPVVRAPVSGPWDYGLLSGIGSSVTRVPSLLPDSQDELPPLLITTGEDDVEGV